MRERYPTLIVLGLLCVLVISGQVVGAEDEGVQTGTSLKILHKIYLMVHPLYWVDFPEDDPRRNGEHAQQFPDRWELARGLEFKLQQKYYGVIRQAKQDEGMFFLPTREQSCVELLELARQHFGKRLVALEDDEGYKFDRDMPHIRKLIGAELSLALDKSLDEDRRKATENRGKGWEQGLEWKC